MNDQYHESNAIRDLNPNDYGVDPLAADDRQMMNDDHADQVELEHVGTQVDQTLYTGDYYHSSKWLSSSTISSTALADLKQMERVIYTAPLKILKSSSGNQPRQLLSGDEGQQKGTEKINALLCAILLFQFMDIHGIAIFCKISLANARQLVRRALDRGLIQRHYIGAFCLYFLTPMGLTRVSLLRPISFRYDSNISRVRESQVFERLAINRLVPYAFDEFGEGREIIFTGSTFTHRQMNDPVQPDLSFTSEVIRSDPRNTPQEIYKVAIELELTYKSDRELDQKLIKLADSDYDDVVFFASNDHLKKRIESKIHNGVYYWVKINGEWRKTSKINMLDNIYPQVEDFSFGSNHSLPRAK